MYLNCHSYFSFKYGTMSHEQLLSAAQLCGIEQMALTDINNTSGILDFVRLAPKYGIRPVAGIDFRNETTQQFTGIAINNEGFRELNDFLSHHLHEKKPIPVSAPILFNSFIVYPFSMKKRLLKANEYIGIRPQELNRLAFSEWKEEKEKVLMLATATFRDKSDFNTHRLLRAIGNNTLLTKLTPDDLASQADLLVHKYELIKLFGNYPYLIENTVRLLGKCSIDFEFGKSKNKKTFTGNFYEDELLLKKLCDENLRYRYPTATAAITERYEKEIKTITEQGFASYFLINHDIVHYAQHKNYYYVGRGSGANSMVAYLLRITDVDPIDLDLYFERFMNAFRTSPPDFDLDFSWADRDDVIDYIFKKHGHTHVSQLATYSTFQWNAAIRELGKVFGLPKAEIDTIEERIEKGSDKITKAIYSYGKRLIDMPNHLSIHAGGILISEKETTYYTALSFPPKGFPLTQFSMLEAEDVGLYKFDILSQRGLGKMKDAVTLIKSNQNIEVDIHDVQRFKEDAGVRKNLEHANLIGCFYVESPAMRMLLTKLKAKTYLDLVAASSIIRPGVAQSGMMQEYIKRFHDPSRRKYVHPKMGELMSETYGVMVYQEDVIKVAHFFAKLTLGEADMLRRGMSGKYRGREEFQKVEKKFFDNCKAEGYADEVTKEVWRQIESFAGYAFSKGHSASYAVESYQCMFLKTYFPLEYMVAVINNGGGFYGVEYYVHEAKMCGATIHLPDINKSEYLTCIYGKDIYLGLCLIAELESATSEKILAERSHNSIFISLEDFATRVDISLEQIRILIRTGAFRFTGRMKQQLLWDIHMLIGTRKKTEVRNDLFPVPLKKFQLPELMQNKIDDAWDEIEILGFSLSSPFDLILENSGNNILNTPGTAASVHNGKISLEAAQDFIKHPGKIVSITGYMVTRKRTSTKHKEEMSFGTFLDRTGNWIDTTHFPNVLKEFPFRGKGCYHITGKVVEEFGFFSLDVTRMERLNNIEKFSATELLPDNSATVI
ncbi:MAG: DNA polymerase III subunit alpha [Bacteroidetes bacterium]|nr:DNA polymerase III subunit alpha [Bacteroidota bacterium]